MCRDFKNFHTVLKDGIVMNVSLHLAEPGETQDKWENVSNDMVMLYIFGEAKDSTVSEYIDLHSEAGPKEAPQTIIIASKI